MTEEANVEDIEIKLKFFLPSDPGEYVEPRSNTNGLISSQAAPVRDFTMSISSSGFGTRSTLQ